MLHTQCSGYVFPKDIRYFFLFSGILATLSITAFSGFMWYVAFTQPSPEAGAVAVIFDLLVFYLAYAGERNFKTVNMRFTIDDNHVSNIYGGKVQKIELELQPIIKEITIRFAIVKSTMHIKFLIITCKALPSQKSPGKGGLEEVRLLCEKGVIILPADNGSIKKFMCG